METRKPARKKAEALLSKDLLIYAGRGGEYGRVLARRIKTTVCSSAYTTHDLADFTQKLSKPKTKPMIAVLVASSDEDLNDLLEIKDWLEGAKVILILPSDGWGWIDQAHRFRPRFLGFTDEDQGRVIQVLEKMLSAEYL